VDPRECNIVLAELVVAAAAAAENVDDDVHHCAPGRHRLGACPSVLYH
jgi:hypothetical protein